MSHSYPIRRLALGCSALALATALAMPAQAQSQGSFQGNANVVFGSASVSAGSGTTNVNVGSASAVIDWTPFDTAVSANTPITWQPAGTTATFTGTAGNFAVLNRIVPTDTSRPIVFGGTVISQFFQGQTPVRGGTVFFYSPGGIVLAGNSVFDVGNLGLTTAPPVVGPNGDWYTNNTVQFGQSASGRAISIQGSTQINATQQGSYVAAFAPNVSQVATVNVNGQAAFVAAEAGTITFNPSGLFDIQVTVGSDSPTGIIHRGTTTGPASSGAGDNHRIYMVAIPKNNAMQLLIDRGSTVGFAIAGAADVQGNVVVLSAGRNIAAGQIAEPPVGGTGEAVITIDDSDINLTGTGIDFNSAVVARASGRLLVDVFRQTRFASDAFLRGDAESSVSVGTLANTPAGALTVGGTLTVSARAAQTTAAVTGDAGTALLTVSNGASASITRDLNILAGTNADRDANGVALGGTAQANLSGAGSVTVGRDLIVDASGFSDGAAGSPTAQGGNVQVNLTGGATLSVTRVARLNSYGIAGLNIGTSGQGRDGAGGFSSLSVNSGSAFTTAELNIAADGVGGRDVGAGAGRGVGGTAQLIVQGANSRATVTSVNVTGDINLGERDFLSAEGFGGQTAIANGTGGSAQGGSAAMQASAGGSIALPTNSGTNLLRFIGRATGGNVVAGTAGTGGAATGGSVSIFLDAGTLTGGQLLASSFAMAGGSTDPAVATSVINGGNALGGTRTITVQNGSSFSAGVTGGPGAQGGNASASGRGGDGTGGSAVTVVDNSTLNVPVSGVLTFSQNSSGSGAIFGDTSGGSALLSIRNNSTVNVAAGGTLSATARNSTFAAPFADPAQSGGNVVGGNAQMQVLNSSITGSGTISVEASAFAGHQALAGANANGGAARLEVTNGSIQANSLTIRADGEGSDFGFTETARSGLVGGNGTGGIASAVLNGGTINVSDFEIVSEGSGGTIDETGSTALAGGAGQGGTAILQGASGASTVTAGNLRIDSSGSGGTLFGGTGTGGSGTGGEARIEALAGAGLTVNAPVDLIAEGDGGSARDGGIGGAATGGRAYSLAIGGTVTQGGGGTIALNGNLFIDASASSGDGTTAGVASGGLAYLQSLVNAVTTVTGDVVVRADAYGGFYVGSSGAGGSARGGTAQILASNGNARLTVDGAADLSANAYGGIGARDATGSGGNGGAAVAGLAEIGGSGGPGNALNITGQAFVDASADAGYGDSASGGNATGGRALITAGDGTALSFGGSVIVEADANGGQIFGFGGIEPPAGSQGGNATGGTARIRTFGTGGSIAVTDSVTLSSLANGGSADTTIGDGGDALAGFADILARGGTVRIGGAALLGVETFGGSGATGGDAGLSQSEFFESGIEAVNGSVEVTGQTFIYAAATGGDGLNGGAGGAAIAGSAFVDAGNSAAGGSAITLSDLSAYTAATGGNGGDATNAAGGAGGAATSTNVQVFGNAGNGRLSVTGGTQLFAVATGGTGGASDTGPGGAGGTASSGRVQVGTRSGVDAGPSNTGSATFTNVSAFSQSQGGQGGDSTSGTGGAGGNATSFGGVLLVRGSPVTADSVSVFGFGVGGNGGSGATLGAGGFGAAGNVSLTASQRFQRTERGSATIGSLSLVSLSQGGSGATPGASYYAADGGVFLTQSDVTIGSLSYSNIGELAPPPAVAASVLPISLVLSSASLTVDSLSMSTPGEFLLNLDNSSITANSFAISAGTFVLPATAPAAPGTITVRDSLSLAATAPGGSVRSFANFVSNNAASFSSVDSIVLGNIDTEGLFAATSQTGTITVGNVDAGSASLTAQGNIQAGNVRVTGQFAATSSAGTLATGTINAAGATLVAQGNVVVGNAVVSGAFSADSNGGSLTVGTIDAATVALGGATDITAQRITASSITAEAGGTLNVLGAWTAPSIFITANDLAIPNGGALSAGPTGSIQILTTNTAGAFVGDGLSGQSGFRLSNAEFGRISGNDIFVGVLDTSANAVDLTIGTLTIAASQLSGDGFLEFATGTPSGQQSGRIRIDGAVSGGGYTAAQEIAFTTGSFELNAETGSIALAGNGPGGLGGIVTIDAANIHIASPAILAKLRADPRYAGVADEINAPAAVQRPDGVLRALGFQLFPSDTLYIQNTGTAANPAGFYVTAEESDIEPPGFEDSTAPDVDAIINGRFATATGDISGRDVFAAVSDEEDVTFDGFSASSQINGCAFSSEACGPSFEDSPELAVVQSEIELLSGQTVEEEPFDLEESSEEEEEESEQAARAPIEPPVILIDTRPLNPPLDIVDPVSGSGNPASLAPDPANPGAGDDQ